jgi:Ca2+-binding RTX toxin-like protein
MPSWQRLSDVSARSQRPVVESLERRTHLSASLGPGGLLSVTGTDGNDVILVGVGSRYPDLVIRQDPPDMRGGLRTLGVNGVIARFRRQPPERLRERFYEVQLNGEVRRFDAGRVRRIVIRTGGGDDSVGLNGDSECVAACTIGRLAPVRVRAAVMGGDGNDWLVGGSGRDTLIGAGGNDRIHGSVAGDVVDGGDGDDFLTDGRCYGPGHIPRRRPPPSAFVGGPGHDQFSTDPAQVRDLEAGETAQPINECPV